MTNKMFHAAGWLAAGCLMVVMTAAPAVAQGRVTVNVPFSFTAGTESLPAGQYVFERNGVTGTSLMKVYNVDRNEAIALATLPTGNRASSGNPRLLFEVLEGHYRLAEVWTAGAETGARLARTREQALIAKRAEKIETFALALPSVAARGR